jgi:hypothetical protein
MAPRAALADGLAEVCRAVGELGFQASVAEIDGDRAAIATPTCPLRPLVRERPEAAVVDRAMWAGLAARAVAGCTVDQVECETHDCLGDHSTCRVLLRLRSSKT